MSVTEIITCDGCATIEREDCVDKYTVAEFAGKHLDFCDKCSLLILGIFFCNGISTFPFKTQDKSFEKTKTMTEELIVGSGPFNNDIEDPGDEDNITPLKVIANSLALQNLDNDEKRDAKLIQEKMDKARRDEARKIKKNGGPNVNSLVARFLAGDRTAFQNEQNLIT